LPSEAAFAGSAGGGVGEAEAVASPPLPLDCCFPVCLTARTDATFCAETPTGDSAAVIKRTRADSATADEIFFMGKLWLRGLVAPPVPLAGIWLRLFGRR